VANKPSKKLAKAPKLSKDIKKEKNVSMKDIAIAKVVDSSPATLLKTT